MQEGLVAIIVLAALLLGVAAGLWGRRRLATSEGRSAAESAAPDRRAPTSDAAQALALQRLVGGVAHDLNSSLSVVVMNLDVMQQDAKLAERYGRRVDNMMKAMQKASRLTRFLLSFAHPHKPQMDVVSIADLLPPVVELLRAALGKQIELTTVLADDLWSTEIDIAAFETAIIHLAAAVADAVGAAGRLTIEAMNLGRDGESNALGEHVVLAMSTSGPEPLLEARTQAAASLRDRAPSIEMVEDFAGRCGGYLRITADAPTGLRAALYLPRCRETAEV